MTLIRPHMVSVGKIRKKSQGKGAKMVHKGLYQNVRAKTDFGKTRARRARGGFMFKVAWSSSNQGPAKA